MRLYCINGKEVVIILYGREGMKKKLAVVFALVLGIFIFFPFETKDVVSSFANKSCGF